MTLFALDSLQSLALVLVLMVATFAFVFVVFGAAIAATVNRLTGGKSKFLSCFLGFAVASVACGYSLRPAPPPVLEGVLISPTEVTLAVGEVRIVSVKGKYSRGGGSDLSAAAVWRSQDERVATLVKPEALSDRRGYIRVVGVNPGATDLLASYGGKSARCRIEITEARLEALELSPRKAEIPVGGYQDYKVLGRWSDGRVKDLTSLTILTPSDPAVVVPHPRGASFEAKKKGRVEVGASYLSWKTTASLTVR